MAQAIEPVKLRTAAEHLEWVLRQYPDVEDVQALLDALMPLINESKAGKITQPIASGRVPGAYNFGEGSYIPYKNPSVDEAYTDFRTELKGGLTEQDKRIIARIAAMQVATPEGQGHD